mgnify:CR=1 FL=1
MIRLNYSSSGTDTNALWVNYQVSSSEALYSLTSSYDQSLWELSGSIISNKTQAGDGWLLVQSNRNQAVIDYIWNTFQKYLNRKYDGGFIDTERVWVSGSNDPAITDYVSNNENGTFNTYQN